MIKENKIIKAIQKINPNAEVSISEEDINSIIWENETTPISKEDIEAQIPTVEAEIEQEKIDKANARTTGKAKLKSGEALTDAEIKALFGDN